MRQYRAFSIVIMFTTCISMNSIAVSDTTDDAALFEKAVKLSSMRDWSNAGAIFREISARNPTWVEAKNNLAVALFNQGKVDLSRTAIEEAVTSLPNFKIAQENRQKLYDHSAAIAYNKALGKKEAITKPELSIIESLETPIPEKNDVQIASPIEEDRVRESLTRWATAWASSDVGTYLSSYSSEFKPDDADMSYEIWRNRRTDKLRFAKIIDVSLSSMKIFFDEDRDQAIVEFIQRYKARNYQDKVLKQVKLTSENGLWVISAERELQKL